MCLAERVEKQPIQPIQPTEHLPAPAFTPNLPRMTATQSAGLKTQRPTLRGMQTQAPSAPCRANEMPLSTLAPRHSPAGRPSPFQTPLTNFDLSPGRSPFPHDPRSTLQTLHASVGASPRRALRLPAEASAQAGGPWSMVRGPWSVPPPPSRTRSTLHAPRLNRRPAPGKANQTESGQIRLNPTKSR